MRQRLSLRGRGVQLLSQREHSRQELRRKLLQHLRADDAPLPDDADQQVDDVLAWLQDKGYFSEQRFVESRVHVRESRYGNLRIRQELAQHGVTLDADQAQRLKETELARAHEVWVRKFGAAATDPAGRAKQQRFLAGRGFSAEVIRRVVKGDVDEAAW
jgi:regulatory protein